MNNAPTTEDRIWAVISHLSSLALGMGIVLPIIGWVDQRSKSNYASFQCLQALGYQSLGFTVWVLAYLVLILGSSIVLVAVLNMAPGDSQAANRLLMPGIIFLFIVVFGFFALYFVLPIGAAVACALGRDYRYPILGERLARYLKYDPAGSLADDTRMSEDHEFRWVAAMSHFSILIILWGMLAPLTAWLLHGKHSLFLKFQSIQTLAYQAVTTLIYFIGGFFYVFGFLLLIVSMRGIGEPDLNSTVGIVSLVVFGISLLISIMLILLVPLLHILGQWAGYRVLKGVNYRYPLVGRLVNKWISDRSGLEERPR